jgi:arginine exporter protein ArgO
LCHPLGYRAPMPDALVAGILAGYAIAIPVGPIAVLIFETGVRRGAVVAAAAGAGAASADGFYATVAALVGAALAGAITPVIGPARILGGALLAFIAARSLWAATRAGGPVARQAADDPAMAGRPAVSPDRSAAREGVRWYLLFLGLTIVNPMTFLYFGALMLGLPPAAGSEGRVLFVAGAFAASLSWQLLLAAAGSVLHGRLSPRLQATTRVVGALIVLAFAARLALTAG